MKTKLFPLLLAAVLMATAFSGCGSSTAPATSAAPEPAETPAPTAEPTQAPAETLSPAEPAPQEPDAHPDTGASESGSKVASTEDMTTVEEVVEPGMTPVYADSLNEGVYPVEMKSSSSMFKADHVELQVTKDGMFALLYMNSTAYPHMYAGTAQEAAEAAEEALIPLEENGEFGVFTLPVEALDEGLSFAAFSRRKELWYDRTLLFRSDSLPAEAFGEGYYVTAQSLGLEDGEYTCEVTVNGGSGKASVQSPAVLTVDNGVCTATVIWSSSNYDYMKVDGEQYLPLTLEGGSTFAIPVLWFDKTMPVLADTTAMSQPHEIEYSLTFDSASLEAVGS